MIEVNAANVSRQIRKAGFSPARSRRKGAEGILVTQQGPDCVRVKGTWQSPRDGVDELHAQLLALLNVLGYRVSSGTPTPTHFAIFIDREENS